MATTLKLRFGTGSGEKTWSVPNASQTVTGGQVKALMEGMIANGSIYKYPPLTIVTAEIQTTTTTPVEMPS